MRGLLSSRFWAPEVVLLPQVVDEMVLQSEPNTLTRDNARQLLECHYETDV